MSKNKALYPENTEVLSFQIREAYKTARTNIEYSILKKGCKKIAFTSSGKGEGKTITAINIASAFAQQVDASVLIVDCDLRRPKVHVALDISHTPGLVNYLNDKVDLDSIIKETKIPNLKAVCYGIIPPNPSELLASSAMTDFIKAVESKFDYVIFDTPPINVVIDALPIVKDADGVVVVVSCNSTTNAAYNKAVEVLERSGAKIIGVVMNRIQPTTNKKYGGYSYGYY